MNAGQWALVLAGFALLNYLVLRWVRWNTRLPIPGRAQDVRTIMRRQVERDLARASERR